MSILSNRRSPYPFHFKIGSVGLMLGQAKPGAPLLSASKTQDIAQVQPPDFSYGGTSPISDREEPYESLALGMGMKVQEKWQDYRYAFAQGVDCSVWPWCKGPEITMFTPPTRDSVAGAQSFFELGTTLYSAQGQYVLRRNSDASWTMVKDFGAGVAILNTTVFTSNFDGVRRVFVALSSGQAHWSPDGNAWNSMPTFGALAFAVIGREFWWADDVNELRKCDTNADPTNEANYTSLIFRAGDKSSSIRSLAVTAGGVLLILKTDGIYTLDSAGADHSLFPFLKFAQRTDNGRFWGQFENGVYASYGQQLLRIDPDLSMQDIGPEQLVNNDSPVRGQVTGFAAVGGMFAYAALYNPDTLTGYLMKFGAWPSQTSVTGTTVRSLAEQGGVIHIDAWHGSLSDPFPNRAIQALFVSSIGAPANHTRTYLGFSDGSVGWMINPCVPNPSACSAYRYTVGDAFVELPRWHGGYHASRKSIRHAAVTGARFDSNNYVSVEYQIDAATGWTALADVFDSGDYEQHAFPIDTSGVLVGIRVHLHSSVDTTAPLVSSFALGHALRPKRYMTVQVDILCSDGLVRRDGVPLRIGRREILRVVEAAVDTPGAVLVTLPDERIEEMTFTDYSVSQSFDEVGRQWRGSLQIKAVQWESDTP